MRTIKGIIFDFDGVILDTEVADYAAWLKVFEKYGAKLPKEDWVKIIGSSAESFDVVGRLQKQVSFPLDRAHIKKEKETVYRELIQNAHPMAGIEDMISAARENGLKLAIASSSPATWVHGHLEMIGLRHQFDVICTADDVEYVKPRPDLFLLAARRLALHEDELIIIEDSYNGVMAAQAAGIPCLAVPNEMTRGLDFSAAAAVVDSLADVDLAGLLSKVGGKIQS